MPYASVGKIILVMLFWAACFPLITVGIKYAPHLGFAALRAVVSGAALLAIAVLLRRPFPTTFVTWAVIALIGIGATSLGFFGMFHAAEFIGPGIATVIANSQPLLAAAIGTAVLSERLTPSGYVGLALGFLGILVIALPNLLAGQETYYGTGVAFILLAASGITISNVLIKKVAGSMDGLVAMGLQLMIGSIPLIAIAASTEEFGNIRWNGEFISTLLALSLLGTSLAYWLWMTILETVPLYKANAFSFLVPIFGLMMGMFFFDETISIFEMIGISVAVAGVIVISLPQRT